MVSYVGNYHIIGNSTRPGQGIRVPATNNDQCLQDAVYFISRITVMLQRPVDLRPVVFSAKKHENQRTAGCAQGGAAGGVELDA